VAVQVLEVETLARAAGSIAALFVRRHLDLDDVGPPIGELADASGSRADTGQVEHSETGKGLRRFGNSHRRHTAGRYRSGEHSPIKPTLSTAPCGVGAIARGDRKRGVEGKSVD